MNYSELSDLTGKEAPPSPSEDREESISVRQKACSMRLGRQRLMKMKGQTKLTTHKNSTRQCCKMFLPTAFLCFVRFSRIHASLARDFCNINKVHGTETFSSKLHCTNVFAFVIQSNIR